MHTALLLFMVHYLHYLHTIYNHSSYLSCIKLVEFQSKLFQVVKGEIPVLDSKVYGSAEVKGEDSQHATLVQLVDDMVLLRSEVSGPLHKIENDRGYVQMKSDNGYVENVPFQLSVCSPRPKLGDMLKVDLQEFNGVLIGSSVSHIRKRRFTSYVLRVTPHVCTLEESIYFTRDVCVKGYTPQPNDIVCGFAVECTFKDYVWRATELAPSSSTLYGLRAPLELYKLPSFCLKPVSRECYHGNADDIILCRPHATRLGHLNPGDSTAIQFILENTSHKTVAQLHCIMVSDNSILQCHVSLPRPIHPSTSETIDLTFTNADLGQHITLVTFKLLLDGKAMYISRRLHVNVIEPKTGECLRARMDQPFLEGSQVMRLLL